MVQGYKDRTQTKNGLKPGVQCTGDGRLSEDRVESQGVLTSSRIPFVWVRRTVSLGISEGRDTGWSGHTDRIRITDDRGQ